MTLRDTEKNVAADLVETTSRRSSAGDLTAPAALVYRLECAVLAPGKS